MVKTEAELGFGQSWTFFGSYDHVHGPYRAIKLPYCFHCPFRCLEPIGCSVIYGQLTVNLEQHDRVVLAQRIAINSAVVLSIGMWAGGLVLSFCGIGMDALRTAGGLVIAVQAWKLLSEEASDDAKASQKDAFFPLTIPLTTGPSTISVAIALGSGSPEPHAEAVVFVIGVTLAAVAMAAAIAFFYSLAHRLAEHLGKERTRTIVQLSAFLLLCIGVQILSTGLRGLLR